MKKKILFWILGIIGVLVIAGGVYAYTVYSNVSNALNTVHKPLERDKSDKRDKEVNISDNKPISILLMG
ncbi:TPA: LytR family transcriptional regulator, partial [Streptococcus agalactiae]